MGNPAAVSPGFKFRPQNPAEQPGIGSNPVFAPNNPGLISQMVQGMKPGTQPIFGQVAGNLQKAMGQVPPKKQNLQKAQRMNPPEVPTRRLY